MPVPRGVIALHPETDVAALARDCRRRGLNLAVLGPRSFEDGRAAATLEGAGPRVWLNQPVPFEPE